MCSGFEAGSYLRLIDFVYHSTLGLRVTKKKKEGVGFGDAVERFGTYYDSHPRDGLGHFQVKLMFGFSFSLGSGKRLRPPQSGSGLRVDCRCRAKWHT